ncbi:MAG: hypothetical protein IJ167_00065 [Lachnospiraceae bacterium]|nr:hypothetical protein [Lachnospiraceae bacterium]
MDEDIKRLKDQIEKQREKVARLKEGYDYSKERYDKERERLSQLEKDVEVKEYRRMMSDLKDRNIDNEEQLMKMLDSLKSTNN